VKNSHKLLLRHRLESLCYYLFGLLLFFYQYFWDVPFMTVFLQFKKYTLIYLLCLLIFTVSCDNRKDALESVKISPIDGKEMVLVPAGEFIMGTNKTDVDNTQQKIGTVKPLYLDQHPERKVMLDAYYIYRYEVTNSEYKKFMDDTQYPDPPTNWVDGMIPEGREDHPVTSIIW